MIAAADGRLLPEVIRDRVLSRIGMDQSVSALHVEDRPRYAQGYEPSLTDRLNPVPAEMTPTPWVDSDNAAGCVAATPGDMIRFLRFLMNVAGGKGAPVR